MGRTSTKENKNSYQLAREELGLTREKASELLETIAPERIEKIENERTVPRPDEVLTMAESTSARRCATATARSSALSASGTYRLSRGASCRPSSLRCWPR